MPWYSPVFTTLPVYRVNHAPKLTSVSSGSPILLRGGKLLKIGKMVKIGPAGTPFLGWTDSASCLITVPGLEAIGDPEGSGEGASKNARGLIAILALDSLTDAGGSWANTGQEINATASVTEYLMVCTGNSSESFLAAVHQDVHLQMNERASALAYLKTGFRPPFNSS